MAMSDDPLTNLGELTKPATVLIEKISDAVGGVFKPYQIVRVAKAEAEADRIHAESQIQITDLHRRAMHRFLEEEAKKQSNIEAITTSAIPLLDDNAAPQNVADDWITNFFDKSRIVSDEDMQQLWSQVLAGEANAPGAFAKRTVNLLADLDKGDAELFTRLCDFGWMLTGDFVPLVLHLHEEIYGGHGINFDSLVHLESFGLIQLNINGFKWFKLPKTITAIYHHHTITLTFPADLDNELQIGQVLLTRAGQQLARICASNAVDGFFEFVYDRWAGRSLVPERGAEHVGLHSAPEVVPR